MCARQSLLIEEVGVHEYVAAVVVVAVPQMWQSANGNGDSATHTQMCYYVNVFWLWSFVGAHQQLHATLQLCGNVASRL